MQVLVEEGCAAKPGHVQGCSAKPGHVQGYLSDYKILKVVASVGGEDASDRSRQLWGIFFTGSAVTIFLVVQSPTKFSARNDMLR